MIEAMSGRPRIRRDALAIGLATGAYGLSFGALSVAAGLSVAQTSVLSLLMFTGASQFALVGVVASGGSGLSAVSAAALVGSRNAFYGLRVQQLLQLRGWRRPAAAQLVIDESTAMAIAQPDVDHARHAFWATGLSVFLWWNVGTLIGAVGAEGIADPKALGLDAAAPAAFVALLWPQLRDRSTWVPVACSCAVALALAPFVAVGVPVLAVAALVVLLGLLRPVGPGSPVDPDDDEGRS